MRTTKEITEKHGLTRQTINNWIWTSENETELSQVVLKKRKKLDTPTNYLQIQNRRYLGSKQKMLNFIDEVITNNTTGVEIVADIFGGTGVVADLFRKKGKQIIVNDILYSNFISFETWFGNEEVNYEKIF